MKTEQVINTTNKKAYILILNYNNWQDTIECLESVFQNSYPDYQVICIDNASTDDSEHNIKDWAEGKRRVSSVFFQFNPDNKPIPYITYDRIRAEAGGDPEKEKALFLNGKSNPLVYIKTDVNLGYGGGNNVGMRYVLRKGDSSFIWILNNDTVVEKNALLKLISYANGNNTVGMVGSKLLYYDKPNILQSAGGGRIILWMGNTQLIAHLQEDNGSWDMPLEPDYICGASLLIKRELIEDIGLIDEQYFLYWEDADWGARVRNKKYRLLYCPESRVWHKEGSTSGGINQLTDYYWTRNGLIFIKKHYPALLPLIPFSYFTKHTVVRAIKKQPLNFSSFISGMLDFLKGKTGRLNKP
jgi:GT2 family glycosyltransferase